MHTFVSFYVNKYYLHLLTVYEYFSKCFQPENIFTVRKFCVKILLKIFFLHKSHVETTEYLSNSIQHKISIEFPL